MLFRFSPGERVGGAGTHEPCSSVPGPPSTWNGVRCVGREQALALTSLQFGSSMRPSIHLRRTPSDRQRRYELAVDEASSVVGVAVAIGMFLPSPKVSN